MKYNQIKIGDSKVLESRETADGTMIRRRRVSSDGKIRFTTYERIEFPDLVVIKRNGKKESFDRDKLFIAIKRSVGKFFDSDFEVKDVVNKTSNILFDLGKDEIDTRQIGEVILDVLAETNEVAYVRFASVFHKFKTLDDFEKILQMQKEKSRQ